MEHDVLTDVYSNDFFISQVESYLKAHPDEDFDLLATDVQDFKLFNEVYDFNLGDNLLRFIAGVLTSNKLLNTIMCGRIGADSFILLAEHKKYTESIFTAVNQEINKFPIDMHIVIRFGVYHIVDRSLPVASMVDSATVAVESLKDKSHRPKHHPNEHTAEEIKLIKDYKANNKETGLVVLWVKLRRAGYTRTIQHSNRTFSQSKRPRQ